MGFSFKLNVIRDLPPTSLVIKGIGVMERELDWVACWAELTNSTLLGTVIFLAESLLKLETDVMRLVTVSVLAEPLGIEHTALSLSVEETVGDKARSSVTTLFPEKSKLEI